MTIQTTRYGVASAIVGAVLAVCPTLCAESPQDHFWQTRGRTFDRSRIQSLEVTLWRVDLNFRERGPGKPEVRVTRIEVAQQGTRFLARYTYDNGSCEARWQDEQYAYECHRASAASSGGGGIWCIRPLAAARRVDNPAEQWLAECGYAPSERYAKAGEGVVRSVDEASRTTVTKDTRYGNTSTSRYMVRDDTALFVHGEATAATGTLMLETDLVDWVQSAGLWFPRRTISRSYMENSRIDTPQTNASVRTAREHFLIDISVNREIPADRLTEAIPEGARVDDFRVDPPVSYKYKKELTLGQIAEMARQRALEKEIQGKR